MENSFVHPSFEACCAAPGSQNRGGDVVVWLAGFDDGVAGGGIYLVVPSMEPFDSWLVSLLTAVTDARGGVVVTAELCSVTLERV